MTLKTITSNTHKNIYLYMYALLSMHKNSVCDENEILQQYNYIYEVYVCE